VSDNAKSRSPLGPWHHYHRRWGASRFHEAGASAGGSSQELPELAQPLRRSAVMSSACTSTILDLDDHNLHLIAVEC
jgi:hypothetical protein